MRNISYSYRLYSKGRPDTNYFLTGIFSSLDVLLNKNMNDIVLELPFDDIVAKTLLHEETTIKKALQAIQHLESGELDYIDDFILDQTISINKFNNLYTSAVKWQYNL